MLIGSMNIWTRGSPGTTVAKATNPRRARAEIVARQKLVPEPVGDEAVGNLVAGDRQQGGNEHHRYFQKEIFQETPCRQITNHSFLADTAGKVNALQGKVVGYDGRAISVGM